MNLPRNEDEFLDQRLEGLLIQEFIRVVGADTILSQDNNESLKNALENPLDQNLIQRGTEDGDRLNLLLAEQTIRANRPMPLIEILTDLGFLDDSGDAVDAMIQRIRRRARVSRDIEPDVLL